MAEITDITPQVKDKLRCNVYLDGRFCCGMSLETVMKNRLKVGMTVGEDQLAALQMESEKSRALDKAMSYLSKSPKTKREIARYLAGKGYLPAVVDYALGKLTEYGFADDEAYAKSYVEAAKGKKGARLIRMELRARGADEQAAEAALGGIGDESASARAVAAKYLRNKDGSRETAVKAYRHLLSKGFDYDTAKAAVDAVMGEWDEED